MKMRKSNVTDHKAKSALLRGMALASVCAFALAAAVAAPVTLGAHGPDMKAAFAGNGNGNGNGGNAGGNGNGKDGAPGQQKQLADDQSSAEDDAVAAAVEGEPGDGSDLEQPLVLPIAEDSEPANNKVIKELAGLPEDSALSEEEEMEAIRSGWGTWRTADGPETVIAQ